MKNRFGFVVTDKLATLIKEANDRLAEGANKDDPMYPYRNRLIEQVSEELVDNLMIKQALCISDPERRASLTKLGNKVQSITGKIVQTMLSKDKDDVVLGSKTFLDLSVARDADGQLRMGMELPEDYYTSVVTYFDKIIAGEMSTEIVSNIQKNLRQFDDYLLNHFMLEFGKTLGWGSIKLKLAKTAKSGVSKANQMVMDKMIPKMTLEELQEIVPHLRSFYFESEQVGSAII